MKEDFVKILAHNIWAAAVPVILLICQPAAEVLAQTNNISARGEKLKNIPAAASAFRPRAVGDNEMLVKRSEIEDRLRKELLAVSEKGAFEELLNTPWNKQTVEQFGKLLITERDEQPRDSMTHLSVLERQWGCIVNLLAFIATTHRDQAVGKCAIDAFDGALAWTANKGRSFDKYWFYSMYAIGMYGSSDLLTPIFWNGKNQGFNCYEAFHGLGNEKELDKLKNQPATDEPIAIGHELKRANMKVPQQRYKGDRTNSTKTNSVEMVK